VVTSEPETVARADRILLPGVGAYGASVSALRAVPGLVDAMDEAVRQRGRPFLGICVGLQLLADAGHEFGTYQGLGWIAGQVTRLTPDDPALPVPHMGWRALKTHAVAGPRMPHWAYFVHSYRFEAEDAADIAATTDYGGPVVAAVGRGNILGVQFHPEKSQREGLAFLAGFLAWAP
jgi:glutamine amidotransferase